MKAAINSTGVLTVSSESELESFALQCWSDSYTEGLGVESSVVLRININRVDDGDDIKAADICTDDSLEN